MIDRKELILKVVIDPRCQRRFKSGRGEFRKGNMLVVCGKPLYDKIVKFTTLKNYKMVSQLIDMYSNIMQTNFE